MAKKEKTSHSDKAIEELNKKRNPFENKFNEDLPFHNFEEEHTLICTIEGIRRLGEKEENKFDVFIAIDVNTGERKYVTTSHTLLKTYQHSLNKIKDDKVVYKFTFKGKTDVNNKPFNRFDTSFCSLQEWDDFNNK